MPKVPIYEQQVIGQPVSMPDVPVDVFTSGGQQFREVGEKLDEIATKFNELDIVRRKTEASSGLAIELEKIEAEAESDSDLDSFPKYEKRINDSISNFTNQVPPGLPREQVQEQFMLRGYSTFSRVRDNFRSRKIEAQKDNIIYSIGQNKKAYISTGNSVEKQMYLNNTLQLIDESTSAGVFNSDEANLFKELTKQDFINSDAEYDALYSPDTFLSNLDTYEISTQDKKELKNKAEKALAVQAKVMEIKDVSDRFNNQKSFNQETEELSLGEKLNRLKEGSILGMYDKSWAKAKEQALLSEKGIDSTTQNKYLYDIVQKINSAAADYEIRESSDTAKNYLTKLLEAEVDIENGMADGLLSSSDMRLLYNRIYTKEATKSREDLPDDLKYATRFFEDTLPRKYVNLALRKYLAVTDHIKADKFDYEQVARNVVRNVLQQISPNKSHEEISKKENNIIKVKVGSRRRNKKTGEVEELDPSGQWLKI